MILQKYPYFRVALPVIPALAMLTTTPVFMVLENDLRILPFIWIMASIPLTVSWILNYFLFKFFKGNVFYQWIASFTIMVTLTTFVRGFLESHVIYFLREVEGLPMKRIPPLLTTVIVVIMNNTLIILFQTLVRYRLQQTKFIQDLTEAKVLRIQAQFENLRNQIHPHFLFNALNTLKILIRKDPEKAEEYTIQVSSFLRSSIQASGESFYSVSRDLSIAQNYIQIQEVRFKDCFALSVDLFPSILDLKLPALTFQCLIENALKHNVLTKHQPLRIEIKSLENDWIEVSNPMNLINHSEVESTGIGLFNLSQRFEILELPKIIISKESNMFSVKFKLHRE